MTLYYLCVVETHNQHNLKLAKIIKKKKLNNIEMIKILIILIKYKYFIKNNNSIYNVIHLKVKGRGLDYHCTYSSRC